MGSNKDTIYLDWTWSGLLPRLIWPNSLKVKGVGSRKWCPVAWWEAVRNTALAAGAGGRAGSLEQSADPDPPRVDQIRISALRRQAGKAETLCVLVLFVFYSVRSQVSPLSSSPQSLVQWHKSNIAPGRYGAIIKWPALGDRSRCCQAAVFLSSRDKSSLWRFLFHDPIQTGTGEVRIFDFYVAMRQLFKQSIDR